MSLYLVATVSPSTSITQAAADACELATRLGVGVEFGFNSSTLLATPNSFPSEVVAQYDRHLERLRLEGKG